MEICNLCEDQAAKSKSGKPHETLMAIEQKRVFKGSNARRFEEQDYQCQVCQAKFTWSNNRNDLAGTLWDG